LRTIEYPHGFQKTIVLHVETVQALKKQIAAINNLPGADSVKQINRYDDYFWTETIDSTTEVRSLKEHSIVLWSAYVFL